MSVKNPTDPHMLLSGSVAEPVCPFGWNCHADRRRGSGADPHEDAAYSEARRQGIYLAACIIDEVAALGTDSPQAVVDEIRRRISELVQIEFNGHTAFGQHRR
jgi:hypothetical protein